MKKIFINLPRILLIGLFVVSFSHCEMFKKEAKVNYPNRVTSEMEVDFNQAENKFRNKKYSAAESDYQSYLQKYPYNRLSDQASYRLGQIQMLEKHYAQATEIFSGLMSKTPDPQVASRAAVKAGISQYRLKNYDRALYYFDKVKGQYVRRHDKIKTGGLALKILEKQGAGIERQGYYYALLIDGYSGLDAATIEKKYGHEAPAPGTVQQDLKKWAETPATPGQIDRRFQDYSGKRSAPYIDYKLGMAYYKAGDTKNARKYLGDLVNNYSSSNFAMEARPVLDQLGYRKKGGEKGGKQYKIGVILPISGKYESYGLNTLNGMECAAGSKAGCGGLGNVRLIIRDDKGSPVDAVQAVEDLVKREDVLAIVGPLSSASALAAAQKAQELGVVLISLAQKEGIPGVGDNIYRFSLTPLQQIKALLLYSTRKKGKKLFGVFYPNTNYGRVFMEKFKEVAPQYGAEVTATQGYKNSKNVQDDIRQLKFSVSKVSPKVPMGFEALFIPDSYVSVLNILPQLANSGMDQMVLLGTNAWNDPRIGSLSGGKLDNSLFLDIYFKDSKNSTVKEFISDYQTAFGQSPTTLEAMGYDIVRFLGQALGRAKVSNRQDFKRMLMRVRGYQGVTGLHSFGSDREANVDPYMLTVQGGEIEEID